MDSSFALIIANFRSDKLKDVEKRLEKLDVERINVCKVKGFGDHNYFAPNWLEYEVRVLGVDRGNFWSKEEGAATSAPETAC